jgi:hypothetical protein
MKKVLLGRPRRGCSRFLAPTNRCWAPLVLQLRTSLVKRSLRQRWGHVVSKAKNLNGNTDKRCAELIQPPLMGWRSKRRAPHLKGCADVIVVA